MHLLRPPVNLCLCSVNVDGGLCWDLKCHISQRHLCCVWRWIGYTGIGLCCVSQEFRTLAPRQILKTKGKRITWLSSLRTMLWRRVLQKHLSRAGTSKDIPLYLWDVITFPTLDVVEAWALISWYLSLCAGDQWAQNMFGSDCFPVRLNMRAS